MDIGKLRHKVSFQNYATAQDDAGQPVKTWSTYDSVWAWIRPLSGREKMAAQQPVAEMSHEITIRYHGSITVNDRIKYGSRYFYINFIGNYDENNAFMKIICREKA
jgi:SPP1 family predicted phage head-tail adaptor